MLKYAIRYIDAPWISLDSPQAPGNKAKFRSVRAGFLGLLAFCSTGCSTALAQEAPSPPPLMSALEFFEPTPKAYSIASDCNGRRFTMQWEFDGRRSFVTALQYGEEDRIRGINALSNAMHDVEGDVVVRLNCGSVGAEIRILEAWPTSRNLRQVLFNLIDGQIEEIHRYNF